MFRISDVVKILQSIVCNQFNSQFEYTRRLVNEDYKCKSKTEKN